MLADLERACLAHMQANGIILTGELKRDGQLHRFSMDSKKNQKDEWYAWHEGISLKNNPYLVCNYGTWSGGLQSYTYNSYEDNRRLSQDEVAYIKAQENERRKIIEKQLFEDQRQRSNQAQEAWEQSIETPTLPAHSEYLRLKQVNPHGVRYRVEYDGTPTIVIPLRNTEGDIQAIQTIRQDGEKRIYGAKKGNFHVLGHIVDNGSI